LPWVDVSQEIGNTISLLKKSYEKERTPINFCFREACNKWIKRSDKYTHLIHRYPAKLLPYIPIFFFFDPAYAESTGHLLDPFAGTGTVLLEGIIHPYLKMNALGVEINPLARLISKVKTSPIDASVLIKKADKLIKDIQKDSGNSSSVKFPNIDFWFKPRARKDLSIIRRQIENLSDSDYKDFFWVCFSSIIRRSSLADPKIAPPVILKPIEYSDKKQTEKVLKQIKEKQRPRPMAYFEEEIKKNISRMRELCKKVKDKEIKSEIIWDDLRTLKKGKYIKKGKIKKKYARNLNGVDLVITSPPYINAQKYIRTLKFELYWLGFVDHEALIDLDKTFIGTERVYKEEYNELIITGEGLADEIIEEIYHIDRQRAGIVAKYFLDMKIGMQKIYDAMNEGGRFVLVVGNNLVRNKKVLNHQILANMAVNDIGFDVDFIARDEIKSRGLITKRHETSGIISDEWVISLSKN